MGIRESRAGVRAKQLSLYDERRRLKYEKETGQAYSKLSKSLLRHSGPHLKNIVKFASDPSVLQAEFLAIRKRVQETLRTAYAYAHNNVGRYVREVHANHRGEHLSLERVLPKELIGFINDAPSDIWGHVVPVEMRDELAACGARVVDGYAAALKKNLLRLAQDAQGTEPDGGDKNGEIRKTLRQSLDDFKDKSTWMLERVARTEITRAYNLGMLQSVLASNSNVEENGKVAGLRYSAILDDKVTPICKARDGLCFALGDPGIAANTPPNHVNCRSFWVPLFEWDVPDGWAGDDWSLLPPTQHRPEDTELAETALRLAKATKVKPAEPVVVSTIVIPSQGSWVERIKAFISSRRDLGTDQDAIALGDIAYGPLLEIMQKSPSPRSQRNALVAELSKIRPLSGSLRFVPGGDIAAETYIQWASEMYPSDWIGSINRFGGILALDAPSDDNRGCYRRNKGHYEITIDVWGEETALHELGHVLEHLYGSRAIEKQFYDRRTKGSFAEFLRDLTGDVDFGDEIAKKGAFVNPYMGKYYHGGRYSEIYSMGLQYLYYNRRDFWERDPEYVKLMLGIFMEVR